jgi:hypothetical protein
VIAVAKKAGRLWLIGMEKPLRFLPGFRNAVCDEEERLLQVFPVVQRGFTRQTVVLPEGHADIKVPLRCG